MQLSEFKPLALRTESVVDSAKVNWTLFASAINVAIGASKILNQLKGNIYYGKPIDTDEVGQAALHVRDDISVILYDRGTLDFETPELQQIVPGDLRILHATLGKFTESGELLEAVAQGLNGQPVDLVNIGEELGDDLWFSAVLADAAGLDMENVADAVIAKLRKRYPQKFEASLAIERDLDGEREVLDGAVEVEQPKAA